MLVLLFEMTEVKICLLLLTWTSLWSTVQGVCRCARQRTIGVSISCIDSARVFAFTEFTSVRLTRLTSCHPRASGSHRSQSAILQHVQAPLKRKQKNANRPPKVQEDLIN